jgi:hypothetical protein
MKKASIVILVVIAVLFGLWFAFVRAPTPEEVCRHIAAVSTKEAEDRGVSLESEAAVIENIERKCIQHKLDKIQLRGRIQYAEYARCVMDSTTLGTIGKC